MARTPLGHPLLRVREPQARLRDGSNRGPELSDRPAHAVVRGGALRLLTRRLLAIGERLELAPDHADRPLGLGDERLKSAQALLPARLARALADVLGLGLRPRAVQRPELPATVGRDPGGPGAFAPTDLPQHLAHRLVGHRRAARVVAVHRGHQHQAQVPLLRRPRARPHGDGDVVVLAIEQPSFRRYPGIEQARGLERRLEPGAILRGESGAEVAQPPERRPRTLGASGLIARMRRRRRSVLAGQQPLALGAQLGERRLPLAQPTLRIGALRRQLFCGRARGLGDRSLHRADALGPLTPANERLGELVYRCRPQLAHRFGPESIGLGEAVARLLESAPRVPLAFGLAVSGGLGLRLRLPGVLELSQRVLDRTVALGEVPARLQALLRGGLQPAQRGFGGLRLAHLGQTERLDRRSMRVGEPARLGALGSPRLGRDERLLRLRRLLARELEAPLGAPALCLRLVEIPTGRCRLLLPGLRVAAGALERLDAAHRRARRQGLDLGLRLRLLDAEPLYLLLCLTPRALRLLELLLGGAQLALDRLVVRVRRAHPLGPAARGDLRVAAVLDEEGERGVARSAEALEVASVGLQAAERVGDVREDRLGRRRQRLGERVGERLLVQGAGELRLPQLDEQLDERVVPLLAQLEEPRVHLPAIRGRGGEDLALGADRLGEPVARQGLPGRRLQEQVAPDALAGDEEPLADQPAPLGRLQPAAEGEEARLALRRAPAELEPGVAEPVRVLVEQQVPLDALGGIAVGLEPARRDLAVEQEGELQREDARLAGAVVAAQQQVALLPVELLVVVAKEVEQAAAQRLPPFAGGLGKPRRRAHLRLPPVSRSKPRPSCRCARRAGAGVGASASGSSV